MPFSIERLKRREGNTNVSMSSKKMPILDLCLCAVDRLRRRGKKSWRNRKKKRKEKGNKKSVTFQVAALRLK